VDFHRRFGGPPGPVCDYRRVHFHGRRRRHRRICGDGGTATLSLFNKPLGVAISGIDVYVADSFNYRIRHLYYVNVDNHPVVDPPRLSFRAPRGGAAPSDQLLAVRNSYVGLTLNYIVDDSDGPWLYACTLTEDTDCYHGRTPDLVEISVDIAGLVEGTYSATLVVSGPIRPCGFPWISRSTAQRGYLRHPLAGLVPIQRAPKRDQRTASVRNHDGPGAAPWSIRRQTESPWLRFSATSGTTPATVDVSVDATGLRREFMRLCHTSSSRADRPLCSS